MTITLGSLVLCHGAVITPGAYTGPDALRLTLTREVQVRQAIGAEEVSLAARKNAVWALSFGVVAEFASDAAALVAAQTLAKAIRETGETPHTLTVASEAATLVWKEAVITGFDAEPIGCSLRVAYALTATQQGV